MQVQRITALRLDLSEREMRAQVLNILIGAYANTIKEGLSEEE